METPRTFSLADRDPPRPLIRHIEQIDIEAMGRLAKHLKHERLVNKICNIIPKTWSDKR